MSYGNWSWSNAMEMSDQIETLKQSLGVYKKAIQEIREVISKDVEYDAMDMRYDCGVETGWDYLVSDIDDILNKYFKEYVGSELD